MGCFETGYDCTPQRPTVFVISSSHEESLLLRKHLDETHAVFVVDADSDTCTSDTTLPYILYEEAEKVCCFDEMHWPCNDAYKQLSQRYYYQDIGFMRHPSPFKTSINKSNKPSIMRHNLKSSRSGYRGLKMLKRLNKTS